MFVYSEGDTLVVVAEGMAYIRMGDLITTVRDPDRLPNTLPGDVLREAREELKRGIELRQVVKRCVGGKPA